MDKIGVNKVANNGQKKSKPGIGGKLLNGAFVGMGYVQSRKEGKSVGSALAKAAFDEIFYSTPVGQAVMWTGMAMAGVGMAVDIGRQNAAHSRSFYGGQFGSNSYGITQNGATMRQRGLDAISRSNMNARNALGSEARSFHRGHFTN